MAGTALAEGSFGSYISDAGNGFTSRTWVDKNADSVATTVTFRTCRDGVANGTSDWADVFVKRYNWAFPATNLGIKRLYCYNSAVGNWGDVSAADYAFTIDYYGPASCSKSYGCANPYRFDVGDLTVSY